MSGGASKSLRNEPYLDRQIISIVPDADLPRLADGSKKQQSRFEIAFDTVGGMVASLVLPSTVELVDAVLRLKRRLQNSGSRFRVVGRAEVLDLVFPPGHPRIGGVYVAHPTQVGTYFPVADFHRLNFENKVNEAIQLLMALGASEISVSHVKGWGRDFSGNLSLSGGDASLDSSFAKKSSTSASVLFSATLEGSDKPKMPERLVWFDYEPTWQSVSIGRLDHGLKNFNLTVSYNDDFGVNAELKKQILKSGLNLSGSFTEHENTTWTMTGKFGLAPVQF